MNPLNTKNKTSKLPEILAVVFVVGAIGYYFYSSGSSNSSSSSFTISSPNSSVGASVLTLLNQIHSLKIDTTLFQSPSYQSLTDFTQPIPSEPIGKANPFVTGNAEVNPTLSTSTLQSMGGSPSSASSSIR